MDLRSRQTREYGPSAADYRLPLLALGADKANVDVTMLRARIIEPAFKFVLDAKMELSSLPR